MKGKGQRAKGKGKKCKHGSFNQKTENRDQKSFFLVSFRLNQPEIRYLKRARINVFLN
jgi:hypothetical protein